MTDCAGEGASPPQPLSEDRRKHIDLVQMAVSRMAGASAAAKGWLLPVATAAFGYSITQDSAAVALLGTAAVLLFAVLDSHYLRQERAFRVLYRKAVQGCVNVYEMNNRPYYGKPNSDAEDLREENCKWRKIVLSWSVGGYYGPMVVAGVIVAVTQSSLMTGGFCIHF